MSKKHIYLGSIEKALQFVNQIDHVDARIYLIDGYQTTNARSLLGVLSMSIDKPLEFRVIGTTDERKKAQSVLDHYLTT